MRQLLGSLEAFLVASQNPDGGWGGRRGQTSNAEATALALVALRQLPAPDQAQRLARGVDWLERRQRPDGAWSFAEGLDEGTWATPLVCLALLDLERSPERIRRGARWLLALEGHRMSWWQRLLLRLLPEERKVQVSHELVGWPWRRGSFSWVEPTAFAVLLLKKLSGTLDAGDATARIRQGELLLADRMCEGGGWNYGNRRVLGEILQPYPEVTAVALLALQDRAADPDVAHSLERLQAMLAESASGLSLGWSMLCLSLHGREAARWRELLSARWEQTGFLGETRSVALAALAWTDATAWLRV